MGENHDCRECIHFGAMFYCWSCSNAIPGADEDLFKSATKDKECE